MKLFYSPGACSLSPHIVLQELGMKYTAEKVDMKNKTWSGGDFNKINPKGYVPCLQLDNNQILTEGAVIVQYLADQKPEAKLIPAQGTMERYRCQEWLNFISTEIHKGFSPLFNPAAPEQTKTMAKERLTKRLEFMNTHLSDHQFVMGQAFGVADAYLFTVLTWSKPTGMDLTPFKGLTSYMERVSSRPAVKAAMQAEGLLK